MPGERRRKALDEIASRNSYDPARLMNGAGIDDWSRRCLLWGLAGLGLSGLTGCIYRDDVLLPLLAAFLMVTGYALWKRRKQK